MKNKIDYIRINNKTIILTDFVCVECDDEIKGFVTFYKNFMVIVEYNKLLDEKHFWGLLIPTDDLEYTYCKDCYLEYLQNKVGNHD